VKPFENNAKRRKYASLRHLFNDKNVYVLPVANVTEVHELPSEHSDVQNWQILMYHPHLRHIKYEK